MKITTARRISQAFFFALFLWLCMVATVGTAWWQWRGWPIRWFLDLDPLVALGTVLSTHSLYAGLVWSLLTIVVTLFLGRVFCGWLCPFGTIHQFVGWVGRRGRRARENMKVNQYHPAQAIKYGLLIALLSAATGNLLLNLIRASRERPVMFMAVAVVVLGALLGLALRKVMTNGRRAFVAAALLVAAWGALAAGLSTDRAILASRQTGLLDPIPLVYRSVNLVLLPLADMGFEKWFPSRRFYEGSGLIGALFLLFVLLNLWVPRFYCRFLCPLGALLGVLGRNTLWSIGKTGEECTDCKVCDMNCEGACNPAGPLHVSECLMCMNCLDDCPTGAPIGYLPRPSTGGEITAHGVTRRGFLVSLAAGCAAAPLARLGGSTGSNWPARLIRPPGAVAEEEFLARCIKCGECMRVCPTNVLQPAGFSLGIEGLWTPVFNNRIGTSACQLNCIACGHACPTGAIRPLTLDEKQGKGAFAERGPIRVGMAYVDRGRCLPWAMERPCIVCEENCPVTPKAIHVREIFQTVRDGAMTVASAEGATLRLRNEGRPMTVGRFATGDYFYRIKGDEVRRKIVANDGDRLSVDASGAWGKPPVAGTPVEVQIRLQLPEVDPQYCIGCGVCEHECPVNGLRAIRVTAENETRSASRALFLRH